MQPVIKDANGHARFQENRIVRFLLDEASAGRKCDLNRIGGRDFPQADWEQFFQLIGYSVTGYHELSQVSDESAREASEAARKVIPGAGGCRDSVGDGGCACGVHSGVERQ